MVMSVETPAEVKEEFLFTDDDFKRISELVLNRAGIALRAEKKTLVYGRLAKRLRALRLNNFRDYCKIFDGDRGNDEIGNLINAITTNLTRFFREDHHFKHVKNTLIPQLVERYQKNSTSENRRIRIWSAGCSSGEEPYSLAMTIASCLPTGFDLKILATDIDTNMVAKAAKGLYQDSKGIPSEYLQRYCTPLENGAVQMGPQIQKMITFKPLNLLDAWPMRGPLDAVFCRNVVIYFDKDTQSTLFNRMAQLMYPGSWLYIGHSESLFRVCDQFELKGQTIYRRGDSC